MKTTQTEPSVTHGTFVLERRFAAAPERVFAALAEPAKKRRWYAAGDHHQLEEFQMDFRVGGREHQLYRFKEGTPFPGTALSNDTSYQDIVPNRRVVLASIMTLGDRRISASLSTFELLPAGEGTDLVFTEQVAFFEGADGLQMRQQGWNTLLDRLVAEVAR